MIHHNLLLIISLLFGASLLVMVAQRVKISYPIFLVIGGLVISIIPGMPVISIDPELVFLIFLPPLLYEAAWFTSWREFWKWRRPIGLLAFGLVIFTSIAVAYFANAIIPGFSLAMGFLLGGIISPPDAVAATSVLKGLPVPKRAITILEGESLINDASSLIVFRFALAAVMTGQFVFREAALNFFVVAGMGIVVGVAIAHLFYFIHRYLPTTANIDVALTLMAPYIMYIVAEEFHFSGVMAVVSGGLFLSFRSADFLNHKSRIQGYGVWSTLGFVLNVLVFILIGLQLKDVVQGLGDYSIGEAVGYGLSISLLTVIVRFIWVYPATFIPRWLSKKIRDTEKSPGWKGPFIVSWSGMRGVVSLASALSVPLLLPTGEAFPHRNIILFITFIVILFTLVFQGLTLPFIIRWLDIKEIDGHKPEVEQIEEIRVHLMKAGLDHLDTHHIHTIKSNELVANLRSRLETEISLTSQRVESLVCDIEEVQLYNRIRKDIINAQRAALKKLRKEKHYEDEILRHLESQLDLDEAKLR